MKNSIALLALGIVTLLAPTTASADDCRHSSRSYTRVVSSRSYYVPQARFFPSFQYYSTPRYSTRHVVYDEPRFDCYGRRIYSSSYRLGGHIRLR